MTVDMYREQQRTDFLDMKKHCKKCNQYRVNKFPYDFGYSVYYDIIICRKCHDKYLKERYK